MNEYLRSYCLVHISSYRTFLGLIGLTFVMMACAEPITLQTTQMAEEEAQAEQLSPPSLAENQTTKHYGDYACSEIISCKQSCAVGECYSQCESVASYEADILWNDLAHCMSANQCRDFTCAQRACALPYQMCLNNGSNQPSNSTTNSQGSYQQGSSQTMNSQMGSGNDSPSSDQQNFGTLNCSDSFWCMSECETQECVDECFEQATSNDQTVLYSLVTCLNESTCASEDDACLINTCYALVESCIPEVLDSSETDPSTDQNPPPSNLSCFEIISCTDSCGTHQQCINECYEAGTSFAQQAYYNLVECVVDQNCLNSECVQAQCNNQLIICEAN